MVSRLNLCTAAMRSIGGSVTPGLGGPGSYGVGVGAGGRGWVGPGRTRLAVRRLHPSLGGRRRRVGRGSLSPELPGPKISVFKKTYGFCQFVSMFKSMQIR